MMRYSVQPRNRIFVKDYEFLSFARNIGKNIGNNISKKLSGKYSQKLVDHAKNSAIDALKTSSKRVIQKTAEAPGDLNGNKLGDAVAKSYDGRITKVSKNSQQNNSETVTNENDKEIPRERYISPEEIQKIIDSLIFIIILQ